MDPIIAAIVAGFGASSISAMIAIVTMAWKMGQWQAEARERNRALCQRLDDFMEHISESVSEAHKRIDRLLELD